MFEYHFALSNGNGNFKETRKIFLMCPLVHHIKIYKIQKINKKQEEVFSKIQIRVVEM